MKVEWNIHYESWLIADGEPDLEVGQFFDWFALEFWAEGGLKAADQRTKSAVPVTDFRYRIVGEVVFISGNACVIDFGLRAIRTPDLLPPNSQVGDYVTGEVLIALPLCIELVPEEIENTLPYKWFVNRITADVTPFVADPRGSHPLVRDKSNICYVPVKATVERRASVYILHCFQIE